MKEQQLLNGRQSCEKRIKAFAESESLKPPHNCTRKMCKASSLLIFVVVLTFATLKAQDEPDDTPKGFVLIGDMELTEEQRRFLIPDDESSKVGLAKGTARVGLENPKFQWPDGIVPIILNETFSETFKKRFADAALHVNENTCVKLVLNANPRDHPNHLNVIKNTRNICKSQVGFLNRGRQTMHLHEGCKKGNIVHELLHVLGFIHMHSAPIRKAWIKIRYKNIIPGFKNYFDRANQQISMYNTPYDFLSIMHYHQYAYSIQTKVKPTIVPVGNNTWAAKAMGQRKGLSAGDIVRIKRMYQCPQTPPNDFASDATKGADEDLVVVTDASQVTGHNSNMEEDLDA